MTSVMTPEMILGTRAFYDGDRLSDNPYRKNTSAYFEWEDGYRFAEDLDDRAAEIPAGRHGRWQDAEAKDEFDTEVIKRRT